MSNTYINYGSDFAVTLTSVTDVKVSSCPGPSQKPPCHANRGDRAAPPGGDAVDVVGGHWGTRGSWVQENLTAGKSHYLRLGLETKES